MDMMRVRPLAGLVAGWLTMFVIGTDLFVVSPLLPMIAADYRVSPAVAGLSVTVFALVGSAAPPDRGATWMALVVSGLLVSLALGAPIGAWAGALFGWMPVFAALAALSLCLVWPNSRIWLRYHGTANAAGTHLQALPTLLVVRRLMPMLLWSTGLYGMYTYLGVGLAAAGFSTGQTARAILFYGCGAIAGVLLGGRLADRLGAKSTAAMSFVGLSACFLTLALAVHAATMVEVALALTSA